MRSQLFYRFPNRSRYLYTNTYFPSKKYTIRQLSTSAAEVFSFPNLDNEIISYNANGLGHFAEASVLGRKKNSIVHAVITTERTIDPTEDFLPLTVDYRDRSYAHCRIPSANNRRDRHGSDEEILVGRIIDRAIRPLFPNLYVDEVQITVTAHALDNVTDPVVLGVNSTSFALMMSKQPWKGPIGCVRVGMINGVMKLNPNILEMSNSSLDLLYAGTMDRPLM
jgi:polyribonucleotide nucleotidyltransferase